MTALSCRSPTDLSPSEKCATLSLMASLHFRNDPSEDLGTIDTNSVQGEILGENDKFKKLKTPEWLRGCTSLRDLLENLMKRDIWPAVEILFDNNKDDALYLGPITRIEEDNFWIRCYDAAGKWEKEYRLTLDEIFRVEFDSRYCTNFNAYMRRRPLGK